MAKQVSPGVLALRKVRYRLVDAVNDIALVRAHGKLADDLALGKHGAGGADAHVR